MEQQQRLRELIELQLGNQIARLAELTVQLDAVTAERDSLKQQIAELEKKADGDVCSPV